LMHDSHDLGTMYPNNDPDLKKQPPTSHHEVSAAVVIPTAALMGLIFGTAFAKLHVFEPNVIRAQFLFQNFIMLKMFCGAMGAGALCIAVLAYFEVPQFEEARQVWRDSPTSRGLLTGIILGTFLLGAGMAVGGACPGMVLSQVGAGVPYSGLTLVGGLLGAFIYGLLEPSLQSVLLSRGPQWTCEVYADIALNVSYWKLATGLAVACIGFAAFLEFMFDWKAEVPSRLIKDVAECAWAPTCVAWPPSVAGVLLGTMQIPAMLLISQLLGSSTAYQVLTSLWILPLSDTVKEQYAYVTKHANAAPKGWWQIPYVTFAILATALWELSVSDIGDAPGIHPASAVLGGFLMLFGSRIAAGCTSGHGISGCAVLSMPSFIGVGAMFAGGISVAVVWELTAGEFQHV